MQPTTPVTNLTVQSWPCRAGCGGVRNQPGLVVVGVVGAELSWV